MRNVDYFYRRLVDKTNRWCRFWACTVIIISHFSFLIPYSSAQQTDEAMAKKHIIEAASKMKTMQCDFVQTKHTKLLSAAGVSTGRLYYRQPDRLRWEYVTPQANTFEIDGQKVLMGDSRGSRGVDTSHNRVYREMARLMTNIMSGQSLASDQDFQVSLAPVGNKKAEWVVTLVPRRKGVKHMFASIILHVTTARWLVRQAELVEPKGDRTVIELKNIQINHHDTKK